MNMLINNRIYDITIVSKDYLEALKAKATGRGIFDWFNKHFDKPTSIERVLCKCLWTYHPEHYRWLQRQAFCVDYKFFQECRNISIEHQLDLIFKVKFLNIEESCKYCN